MRLATRCSKCHAPMKAVMGGSGACGEIIQGKFCNGLIEQVRVPDDTPLEPDLVIEVPDPE